MTGLGMAACVAATLSVGAQGGERSSQSGSAISTAGRLPDQQTLGRWYQLGTALKIAQRLVLYQIEEVDEVVLREKYNENPQVYHRVAGWLAPPGQQGNPHARLMAVLDVHDSDAINSLAGPFLRDHYLPVDELLIGSGFPMKANGKRVNASDDDFEPSSIYWGRVCSRAQIASGGGLETVEDAAAHVADRFAENPILPRRYFSMSAVCLASRPILGPTLVAADVTAALPSGDALPGQ